MLKSEKIIVEKEQLTRIDKHLKSEEEMKNEKERRKDWPVERTMEYV